MLKLANLKTIPEKKYNKLFKPVQIILLLFLCVFFSTVNCTKKNSGNTSFLFDTIPVSHSVIPVINEGSGIADSKLNPGNIWVEEDSDNPPQIILMKHDGKVVKKVFIEGAFNRDWEDMALYDDSIYIADIGDNAQIYKTYTFYIFPEPPASADTVKNFKTISFMYPDGSHDAEAFLLDRKSRDIYIITKSDNPSGIYRLTYPYSASVNILSFEGKLGYTGVVSAAISYDDKEIIVKTYRALNYYKHKSGQGMAACLKQPPRLLPYTLEPQGEAVCFAKDSSGFFTLSEKGLASFVNLYFYPRR